MAFNEWLLASSVWELHISFGGGVLVELQKHRNITATLRSINSIYAYFYVY